jgi:hypothetical protein
MLNNGTQKEELEVLWFGSKVSSKRLTCFVLFFLHKEGTKAHICFKHTCDSHSVVSFNHKSSGNWNHRIPSFQIPYH